MNGMTEVTQTVAEILKKTRESQGRSVEDIAIELNIRSCFLKALEAGRYEDLPRAAFSAGFVRSYGTLLKLDGCALARDFKCEAGGECDRPELNFPEPVAESRMPGRAVLLMGVAASLAIYFGWIANFGSSVTPEMAVSPVPDRLSGLSTESAAATNDDHRSAGDKVSVPLSGPSPQDLGNAYQPAVNKTGMESEAAVSDQAVQSMDSGDERPMAKNTIVAKAANLPTRTDNAEGQDRSMAAKTIEDAEVTAAEKVSVRPVTPPRILIKAKTDTWFYVVDAMDREVWNGVLRAGENWTPRADDTGLRLMTSNAGALRVIVDGVDIGVLGKGGDVVRDVLLTPDGLKKREKLAMR